MDFHNYIFYKIYLIYLHNSQKDLVHLLQKDNEIFFSWSGGVQLIFSILLYIWGPKMVIKKLESDIHG